MAIDAQTQSQLVQEPSTERLRQPSRLRVFAILLLSFVLMITALALAAGFSIHFWEDSLRADIERNLTQKTQMFANQINSDHARSIGMLTSQTAQLAGARATVVDMNGKVISDSEVRVGSLDHEGRTPEFTNALRGETGVNVRSRGEFGMPVLYVAVPVSGGAVRLAYPLADLGIAASRAHRFLWMACVGAAIVALAISALASIAVVPRLLPAK